MRAQTETDGRAVTVPRGDDAPSLWGTVPRPHPLLDHTTTGLGTIHHVFGEGAQRQDGGERASLPVSFSDPPGPQRTASDARDTQ